MDQVVAGFQIFFAWENFLALFIGVIVGTVIGAIPGMTATMGVALALPFTFYMTPVTGILLLLGIYKGGLYGGSIPAILISTPGTPAASATLLDGHPLTKQGKAKKALSMALYASCIADFVSNISLILFAGLIASFALRFGPPEFFALILFSLTIIAGVSGGSLLLGVASALLGLLLATIGLDLIYGTERFIFGNFNLMGGLNFIPVLIGLFALPQILNHYWTGDHESSEVKETTGGYTTWAELRASMKSILRGSLIGVGLGAIPGIGGAPAAFLSYSEAKRTSADPDSFGKGNLEGVAAAEAGNNGVAGATLIPLLALGIPGDVITAVILGAFMIHGLKPGPILFQQNLDIIYALFMGMMLSSLYLLMVGSVAIRGLAKISLIPNSLLYPVVLVLCVFGGFVINNSTFDLLVMFVMGVIGFLMLRAHLPAAPFLIAFILGPLLEDSFRQSLQLSAGDFSIFTRNWICWLFLGLALSSVILIAWRQIFPNDKAVSAQADSNDKE